MVAQSPAQSAFVARALCTTLLAECCRHIPCRAEGRVNEALDRALSRSEPVGTAEWTGLVSLVSQLQKSWGTCGLAHRRSEAWQQEGRGGQFHECWKNVGVDFVNAFSGMCR